MNRPPFPSRLILGSFLILSAIFMITPARAVGGGISDRLTEMLRDLPADRMQTGILYDRVLPLSRIREHDGSAESTPATMKEWRQIYFELSRAATGPGFSLLPLATALAGAEADARRGVVPIAVLNLRYDRLRPDALEKGDLVVRDGRLELGRAEADPFVEARAFAAAPLRETTYRGAEVSFLLDPRDYFSNDAIPARATAIDFDDGRGFVSFPFGTVRAVRYATTGEKTVRVRFEFTGSAPLVSNFLFDVRELRTPAPNETLHITATIPYQGVLGTGEAYVYLSDRHATLTEPIVLIEGFDPENTMNWDELYALLNRQNLIENLRGMGFDAVVLNFTSGADYVQRNGFVAVELIREIQAAIGPGRTMALAGASMGGLVGRYALAYMEAHGIPHYVRTFISFDSPQAGANVPLGLQYWLAFFADQSTDAAAFLADLDTPAGRQMLVYHHTDPPGGSGQADPLRADLLGDLSAVGGYPSALRKVAIANGSGSRLGQGFAPGAQIIRWEYSSFLVSITGDCWAVSAGANATVFHGLIEYFYIPWNEWTVNVAGTRPYDNAPGGWRDSMAELGAVAAPYGDILALYPNHCFIPSISSLALYTSDLFYNIAGDQNILAHTPFDAVYFPADNQEHVDINALNAPWFIAEFAREANDVAQDSGRLREIARVDASPNPFAESIRIRVNAPAAGPARIAVHDATGREVAVVSDRLLGRGEWTAAWDGRDARGRRLAPGVYFVLLRGDGFAATRKVTLR